MTKFICGIFAGLILLIGCYYWYQDHIENVTREALEQRDRIWEDILARKIEEERAACLEQLKLERQKCDEQLRECDEQLRVGKREAFNRGESSGIRITHDHYQEIVARLISRHSIILDSLDLEIDSLNRVIYLISSSYPKSDRLKRERLTSLPGLSLASRRETNAGTSSQQPKDLVSIGQVASKKSVSKPLRLVLYVAGMIGLVMLIGLLILRLVVNRKRRRFQL